jgi:hypothetical protein
MLSRSNYLFVSNNATVIAQGEASETDMCEVTRIDEINKQSQSNYNYGFNLFKYNYLREVLIKVVLSSPNFTLDDGTQVNLTPFGKLWICAWFFLESGGVSSLSGFARKGIYAGVTDSTYNLKFMPGPTYNKKKFQNPQQDIVITIDSVTKQLLWFLEYIQQYGNGDIIKLLTAKATSSPITSPPDYQYLFTPEEFDQAVNSGRYGANGNSSTPYLLKTGYSYNPTLYQKNESVHLFYGNEILKILLGVELFTYVSRSLIVEQKVQSYPYNQNCTEYTTEFSNFKTSLNDIRRKYKHQLMLVGPEGSYKNFNSPGYPGKNYGRYLKRLPSSSSESQPLILFTPFVARPVGSGPTANITQRLRPLSTDGNFPIADRRRIGDGSQPTLQYPGSNVRHADGSTGYTGDPIVAFIDKIAPYPDN